MKLRRISAATSIALFITLFAPTLAAQAADPAAYGVVNSMSGAAIPNVIVDAIQNGEVVATTQTNATGNYEIWLPDGTYELKFTPPTNDFASLASLPIDLPQNWPLNVILTTPSVGKSFLKGFIGIDGGIAAASAENPGAAFCNNGGNGTDANGYFTLGLPAGTSCTLSFQGSKKFSKTDWISFYLSKGPTIALNQDTYLDAIVPMTTTTIRVVDPSGRQLTAADGLYSAKLEVGGEMYWPITKIVGDQITSGQGHKTFPEGKISLFTGMQDFNATWAASFAPDSNGLITAKRPAMVAGLQGSVFLNFTGNKYVSGETKEVSISAVGGDITVVASLVNQAGISGKVTYSDGAPVTDAYVSSGVTGVNTGGTTSADGSYKAIFPYGSVSGGMDVTHPNITYPNGSTLAWEYYIKYKGQLITSNLSQDFTIPKAVTQQVTVLDGDGKVVPNAAVQIGRYYVNENLNRGDPAAVISSNLPKANLKWNSSSTTDANGMATLPAMPMSSPQQMWVSASPKSPSVWYPVNKLITIGNGPITIQFEKRLWKATGSIKSSENFPIITPTIMFRTATGGGGNSADINGNYSSMVQDNVPFTYSISSRKNDIVNPDPLMFNLTQPSQGAITPKSDIAQDFVLPTNYQKVKVVDPSGAVISGAKVVLRVATDEKSPANIVLAPSLPAFVGSFTGYSTTGLDGIAAVPGLVNNQILAATLYVNPDVNSRYLGKTMNLQVGDRKDIVVVLAIKPPVITSISPTTLKVGEFFSLKGSGFLGATSVTIGGVSANFTVLSDTSINVYAPSNATGGAIVVTNGGGVSTFGNVTVTQAPLNISTVSLTTANQSQPYSISLTATGGATPYKWSRVAMGLPNGLNISDSGIISGTPLQAGSWSFTLGVTDAQGRSITKVFSIAVNADPKFIPGTPANLKVSQAGGRINVSWDATIKDNGNPISGYIIQTSTNGSSWSTQVSSTKSPTPSASFPMPNGTYMVRVAAINASGTGAYSNPSQPVLVAAAPNAPTNVSISLSGSTIRTSWSTPANNGSPISGYRIRYSQDGSSWTTLIADTKSTSTSYSFTSPVKGKVYVQVAAINAIDLSPYGTSASFVTVS